MATNINGGNSKANGKGDHFATRPNPFPIRQVKGGAPRLDELQGLGAALDAVLEQGFAIMLGRTRDGGAVVLTVLDGEFRHRTYASNLDELEGAVIALTNTYAD